MQEMTINETDIGEYKARLLSYSVGSTETSVTTGPVRHGGFPILFHTEYGTRKISVTLVFRPEGDSRSVFTKLHSLTGQKNRLDGILYGRTVDVGLPDGYRYRCVLQEAGEELIDGESLEVTYKFCGIRHDELAEEIGMSPFCYSTIPKTDCRISITVGSSWPSGDDFRLYINRLNGGIAFTVFDVEPGDVIELDGINKLVYKSGINVFGNSDIITFPYLIPGENTFEQRNNASVQCTYWTEYYPIYV